MERWEVWASLLRLLPLCSKPAVENEWIDIIQYYIRKEKIDIPIMVNPDDDQYKTIKMELMKLI